jgi:hypothetical protein
MAALWSRVMAATALAALAALTLIAALTYQDLKARARTAELRERFEAKARENAELERGKAELERDKAKTERDLALAERQKQAADFKLKLLEAQAEGPLAEVSGAPRGPQPIETGVLERLENYVLQQLRENEEVPEPLERVIPEAVVASAASAPEPKEPLGGKTEVDATPVPDAGTSARPTRSLALGAAYASLGTARERWATCARGDGPRGAGKVALVLEPSGRVSSVTMDARFAGTAVGRCVDAAFRRVEVPSFEGKPITVLWSFVVR